MLTWNSPSHLKTLSIVVDRFDLQIDINKFASTKKSLRVWPCNLHFVANEQCGLVGLIVKLRKPPRATSK